MSEGTTRGEAAAHILAREMGRRARAIQARIDDVERARAEALAEVQARLIAHDGVDERHAGLIDGLRADLGETHRTALDAVAIGDAEVRQLTEAQASLIDRIAQRVTQAEDDNARQDADVEVLTTRVDAVEAKAAIPGPKGEKGDKGDRGPRGPMGPAGFSGAGGAGGAGTVKSVTAGTGITVGGTDTDPVITNAGVNSVSAGTGISVSGTTALTVTNSGVTSLAGTGVSVSSSTGAVTITAPVVTGGTGISVSGSQTTSLTVTNSGVTSLAGTGVSVSASTGAVTITAPTVSGGTGISVSGSGTTSLTVSATGVNSVTAGTGISVSGTTALTVSATGVQSLTAGTGISVSGTTTPTVTNSGVTSIVAGTNVTVSGATGAVTVNAPAFATPGSSAFGDTAAAGTATTVSRSDHVHGREAAGTPGASAVGDTAAAGTATTLARSDHRHSREAFGTPVVVNGQMTALATGSLTTLARADHVHTVSNVWVKVGSVTTASSATSITFSSIPQTYNFLRLMLYVRTQSVYSLTSGVMRFNSDSSSSYYSADLGTASQTYIRGGVFSGPATYDANIASIADILIAGYSGTSFTKPCYMHWGGQNNTSSTASFVYASFYGIWRSTAAITSVTMTMDSAEAFANGSVAVLMAC